MKYQKAFIQIPILIVVIIFLLVAGGIGTGVVLYKQGKLASLTANISELFKGAEEPAIIDSEKEIVREGSAEGKSSAIVNESIKKEDLECPPCECPICPEPQPCEPKEIIKEVPVEKIVYKEICSCPQTESSPPMQEETYAYHDYYPIILSLSDDKGNIFKYSSHNGYKGSYSFWQKQTLKIGDEIYLKVEASDPQNRQILYNWHSNSEYFNQLIGLEGGHFKWTTNNELRYTITSEDLKTAGETMRIIVQIKSEKEFLRFPGGKYDDVTFVDYILSP